MGKREVEKKPRLSRDWYPTRDPAAVQALAPFLGATHNYIEPCAGDGSLIDLLASEGLPAKCVSAYDIDPQRADITQRNCLSLRSKDVTEAHSFITNPPYQWDMLQPMLDHLPTLLPTWLLLPADMMFNKRMSVYMKKCSDVVAVGRLWWFENEQGKKIKGVDNFAFYKLYLEHNGPTVFHSR